MSQHSLSCPSLRATTAADYGHVFQVKPGSWPDGMNLASERLLDQLPAQFWSGFHHEREALGPPCFDPRLCPMRAEGVDKQGP
jgi:hypothetical protein